MADWSGSLTSRRRGDRSARHSRTVQRRRRDGRRTAAIPLERRRPHHSACQERVSRCAQGTPQPVGRQSPVVAAGRNQPAVRVPPRSRRAPIASPSPKWRKARVEPDRQLQQQDDRAARRARGHAAGRPAVHGRAVGDSRRRRERRDDAGSPAHWHRRTTGPARAGRGCRGQPGYQFGGRQYRLRESRLEFSPEQGLVPQLAVSGETQGGRLHGFAALVRRGESNRDRAQLRSAARRTRFADAAGDRAARRSHARRDQGRECGRRGVG